MLRLTKDNSFLGDESKPQMELMRFVDVPLVFPVKVLEDLHPENFFLLDQVEMRQLLYHLPVRPSFLVDAFQLVVTGIAHHLADGDVHEVLLFFFCEGSVSFSQFLNADQKEDTVHIFWAAADPAFDKAHQPFPLPIQLEVSLEHV